ncbi:MAG: ROK family transcriptional regulator [Solirubrobacteraceae bacterium]
MSPKQRLVLQAVRRHGPLTRADAVRMTGLSRSSIHALTSELLQAGLISEFDRGMAGSRGRPATSFAYTGEAGHLVAIAFEQDQVRVGVADLSGAILVEEQAALDVGNDAEGALTAAATLARSLLERLPAGAGAVLAAAASLPGPVDFRHGTIGSFSILRGWAKVDPARRLSDLLDVPVIIDNDANVAAYAEARSGASVGCRHLLFVKASTGVGAGLIVNGQIYRGAAGMAGELGHVTVEPAGRICRCGSRGCLETVCGIGAITAALIGTHPDGVTIEDVIDLARSSDAAAERALADAGAALGRAIGEVSNVLNPSMVVVGGELAAAGDLLIEPLRASLRQAAMQVIALDLEVRASALGPAAELLGAAALCAAHVHGDIPSSSLEPGPVQIPASA